MIEFTIMIHICWVLLEITFCPVSPNTTFDIINLKSMTKDNNKIIFCVLSLSENSEKC